MRIALVAGEFNQIIIHTGLCSVVRDLARELRNRGIEVSVFLPYFGAVDQNADLHHGVSVDASRFVDDIVHCDGNCRREQLAQVPNTLPNLGEIWLLKAGD